jgi:mannose-6-phosphate isomerase-like protein (cupin superfamily)
MAESTYSGCRKLVFRDHSGYLVNPAPSEAGAVGLGHTARRPAWSDPAIHIHELSEELYLLIVGELSFVIGSQVLSLRGGELLLVRPQVPHAIIGGRGPIEHFGIRAPAPPDKRPVDALPSLAGPAVEEQQRELVRDWGFRAVVGAAGSHNAWLVGAPPAPFASERLSLAVLDLPDVSEWREVARRLGERRDDEWEYHIVLAGGVALASGVGPVACEAGELIEVAPGVRCGEPTWGTPYRGIAVRVPR